MEKLLLNSVQLRLHLRSERIENTFIREAFKKKVWKFPYLTDPPPGMEIQPDPKMFPSSCLIVSANKSFLSPEKVKILRKFVENLPEGGYPTFLCISG